MEPSASSIAKAKGLLAKINRILDILEALLLAPPPITHWPEWMERATALVASYENAMREVKAAQWNCLILPRETGNEAIPNVLLRTKLAPEVEEHFDKFNTTATKDSSNLMKTLAQMMAETSESIKNIPVKTPLNASLSPLSDDEVLIRKVKSLYTAQV